MADPNARSALRKLLPRRGEGGHVGGVAATLGAAGLMGMAFAASFGFVGCSSDDGDDEGPTTDGQPNVEAEPLFRALQDELVATCGGANGSCHVQGNTAPHWLGNPDPYESAKKYRGVLPATRDVGDSIILTQVAHEGPALSATPALYEKVAAWLQAELPPPPLPVTVPFSVTSGFNSVELNTVASGLSGARLSFLATAENGVLTMNALRVTAPTNANVTISSPFFVILPRNGKVEADPAANGFQGEITIPAGTSADFFTGKMILLRWDPTGRLKIAFTAITTTPGQGQAEGCTALDVFTNKALPAMRRQVQEIAVYQGDAGPGDDDPPAGTVIGNNSCLGCHGQEPPPGETPGSAVSAMDLRTADSDPAQACAQARNWINFDDKNQSTIILNPTGKANPLHPIKPLTDADPIIVDLLEWVNAEQR